MQERLQLWSFPKLGSVLANIVSEGDASQNADKV